jgi:hypothetical protein
MLNIFIQVLTEDLVNAFIKFFLNMGANGG